VNAKEAMNAMKEVVEDGVVDCDEEFSYGNRLGGIFIMMVDLRCSIKKWRTGTWFSAKVAYTTRLMNKPF